MPRPSLAVYVLLTVCSHIEVAAKSSKTFLDYIRADVKPGKFPVSPCDSITAHHQCVSTAGCGWLRTVQGVCREDPVARCLQPNAGGDWATRDCKCNAFDFYGGDAQTDADLELFVPLSVTWANQAPSSTARARYNIKMAVLNVANESWEGFTSRTDFTARTLTASTQSGAFVSKFEAGFSLAFKLLHVWDGANSALPNPSATMTGTVLSGMGIEVSVQADVLKVKVGDTLVNSKTVKNYQCNQLVIVVPASGSGKVCLGSCSDVAALNMAAVKAAAAASTSLSLGKVNAKIWDLRIYGSGRILTSSQILEMGKRCGDKGQWSLDALVQTYPGGNAASPSSQNGYQYDWYSWGMGGTRMIPNSNTKGFSSGVYATSWIPDGDDWPPTDPAYIANLNRMVGYWDRYHEQIFFEMDLVPFVDSRQFETSTKDKATLPPDAHGKGERPACKGCGDQGKCSSVCASTGGVCLPKSGEKCADEGGKCQCTGLVRYGVTGKWSSWKNAQGSIDCNNGVFGDPAPGQGGKLCECSSGAAPCDSVNGTAGACCKKGDVSGSKDCTSIPDSNFLHSGDHHQCVLTAGTSTPGVNAYRNYPQSWSSDTQMAGLFNNPCKYVNDMFQALNYLAEDGYDAGEKKIQATSGDHGKIARKGGWKRWTAYDTDLYTPWQRPAHEHGHTSHYTLIRVYNSMHSVVRGISSEGFAEAISMYVMACQQSWMQQGLTYFPTIPLSFEGKWDDQCCSTVPNCNPCGHIFKSPQPYQGPNILPVKNDVHDPPALGARFYGMGFWWVFVSHFVGKPYVIGRLSTDYGASVWGGKNPKTMQKLRFYLAQEGFDLGELYGNFAAHSITHDLPFVGDKYAKQDSQPFKGIEAWCPTNIGTGCTVDNLKVQVSMNGSTMEQKAACDPFPWVAGPAKRMPGGFSHNALRVSDAPKGSLFEFGVDFDVPDAVYADKDYHINFNQKCKDDPRMFHNRIVVEDPSKQSRPKYYKLPGRKHDSVIIEASSKANIYFLAVPTPPFDLEDVDPFVKAYSLTWSYKYRVRRLKELPVGRTANVPIVMQKKDSMLSLTKVDGFGLLYDCFEGYQAPGYTSPAQATSCDGRVDPGSTSGTKQGTANSAMIGASDYMVRLSSIIVALLAVLRA